MRKFLPLLALFILFSCAPDQPNSPELTSLLSEDSSVILKLENPDLFFSNLNNNEFVRNNSSHPLLKSFWEKAGSIRHFAPNSRSFLSFYEENDSLSFTFITKEFPVAQEDSTGANRNQKFKAGEIIGHSINGKQIYTTISDSIYILSDSRSRIEKIASRGKGSLSTTADFDKALRAASATHPVVFINHTESSPFLQRFFPYADFPNPEKFSTWTSLDLEVEQASIRFNGISAATDTVSKFINLFRDVPPTRNELAEIVPVSSLGFYSSTYRDFSILQDNLNTYNKVTEPAASRESELLQTGTEAGLIYLKDNTVFAVKHLTDVEAFFAEEDHIEDFRGTAIHRYSSSGEFQKLLAPVMAPQNLNYAASLGKFLIFSEDLAALREIIGDVANKRTLATNDAYQNALQSLSSESSLLWVNNSANNISSAPEEKNDQKPFDFEGFPITALQFIYNGNFAHVHGVIEKNETPTTGSGVSQSVSISLDAALANQPVFFRNHRSKGMDIAVQDLDNNLYLISSEGNIYWKKQLDSRILGTVQQVDILRNGRYQLAFATQNALHIIDREGNPVKPFPLNFRDQITQPLAIFDYDNKRDYRFVIVQGEEVFMYDNKGRSVKGFKFSKASERITQPPKHIRLGNKDYILVSETSGRLNILSRTGDIRVPVKEEIAFSDNEWYEHENKFVSTNALGQLVQIDQNGNVVREDLSLAESHALVATPKTLVTLSENVLSIKGKEINLDYGLYTPPQIFYLNNKIYVGLTDTQAQRTFLFDSNGELLPGFPVYGTSGMDLDNADGDQSLEMVVKGEENSLLIYELGQ